MNIALITLLGILTIALVLVASVRIRSSKLSLFELERRSKAGNKTAQTELEREQLLPDLETIKRVAGSLLLLAIVVLSIVAFGWSLGVVISFIVALLYGAVARLSVFRSWSDSLCRRFEPAFLNTAKNWSGVFRVIRDVTPKSSKLQLGSRQELTHIVSESNEVLTPDEKKLLINALQFDDKKVREIMTPRDAIASISKRELLGPLILDDLHKTGHSRFPVIDGSIDRIIGVLHIQDLLIVDARQRSVTAEKAMDPAVFYLRDDWSLSHALTAMVESHRHLFVVVNESQETVGLLSLEDVVAALFGRKVTSNFDQHGNLRAVATHGPKADN
jgi:CBS domain containing-hemolysin-like protein